MFHKFHSKVTLSSSIFSKVTMSSWQLYLKSDYGIADLQKMLWNYSKRIHSEQN